MNRLAAALLMMAPIAAASCGNSTILNPPVLWLAENGDELHVKLAPVMPNPF